MYGEVYQCVSVKKLNENFNEMKREIFLSMQWNEVLNGIADAIKIICQLEVSSKTIQHCLVVEDLLRLYTNEKLKELKLFINELGWSWDI